MSDLARFNAIQEAHRREKLRCAFDVSEGNNAYDGLGCFKGKVTREVTIIYSHAETETHYICEECFKRLKQCVRKDGYRLTWKPIK